MTQDGNVVADYGPRLLVFLLLCDHLHLSVRPTWGLLLTSRRR